MAIGSLSSKVRAAAFALTVAILSPCASAQKFLKLPTVEVFGGYSYLRFDSQPLGFSDRLDLNGWNAELSLPELYEGLGVVADFSGHYTSPMEEYNFLIGPQYVYHWKNLRPFGHALFGKARDRLHHPGSTELEPSSLAKAIALGGGVDVHLGQRFLFRAVQADYLSTSVFNGTQNSLRFSTGIIVRFGKH